MQHGAEMRQQFARRLARHRRICTPLEGRRAAAVAIVLTDEADGSASFLLTLRSLTVRSHPGQFALPGGRIEPGETAAQAALRETAEEIGLQLAPTDLLGELDDYPTRSGYVITPVVVWAPEVSQLTLNPGEVERIFRVPVEELDRADMPRFISIPQSDRPVVQFDLLNTTLHAPTAAILYQLCELCLHERSTRVAHYEQPVWAWK